MWPENIIGAVREGRRGEVELDWDSYEKRKQEISSGKLKLAEEQARTNE